MPKPTDESSSEPDASPDAEVAAIAGRIREVVTAWFGSQEALARRCGVSQPAVSKGLSGRVLPQTWLLRELAREGADVTALLTGLDPKPALLPRFDAFLPGGPEEVRPVGTARPAGSVPAPARFFARGTYAVEVDRSLAAATLGGSPADRPRPGDTLIVTANVALARTAAGPAGGPRTLATLPPPVVRLGDSLRLSFAHAVRLHGDAGNAADLRPPLRAEYVGGPTDPPADADGPLPAVGFVVWRSGPLAGAVQPT